jgi:hypothetical protein
MESAAKPASIDKEKRSPSPPPGEKAGGEGRFMAEPIYSSALLLLNST